MNEFWWSWWVQAATVAATLLAVLAALFLATRDARRRPNVSGPATNFASTLSTSAFRTTTILEERGQFWWSDHRLAENELAPDGAIAGLLTIDGNGRISLELDSYLPNKDGPFGVLTDQAVVLPRGIAGLLKTSNSHVLLIGVMQSGGQLRTAGISHQRFLATDCLVGDSSLHGLTGSPGFDNMTIDLSGFESWFWFRSIKISRAEDHISADWQKPEPAIYALDDAKLSFEFGVKGSIPDGAFAGIVPTDVEKGGAALLALSR
jgi:ApeA N-terminal domain 1